MPVHETEPVPIADVVEGTDEAESDVQQFLRDKINSPEIEGDVEVTIHNTKKGQDGRSINSFFMRQGDDARNFAKQILECAVDDARKFFGRTTYTVRAKGLRGSVTFTLTRPFTGDETDEDENEEIENLELPTYKGMANQAMRHTEGSYREMRYAAKEVRGVAQDYRSMNQELRTRVRELEAKVDAYQREIEAVRNMDHARKIDYTRFEKSEKRKDGVAEAFGNHVLPLLGAKLLGPGGPLGPRSPVSGPQAGQNGNQAQAQPNLPRPETRTSIERKAEALVDSIRKEQAMALMQVLSEDQIALLQAMHGEIVARRERERAARGQYAADVTARATAAASTPAPAQSQSQVVSNGAPRSAYAKASGT